MTGTPLPHDSPQFTLFEEACLTHERVRIRYLSEIPNDPALPESMRNSGLETYVIGTADSMDARTIFFNQGLGDTMEKGEVSEHTFHLRNIPKDRVIEISRIGVTDAKPAIDAIAATQVTPPKPAW